MWWRATSRWTKRFRAKLFPSTRLLGTSVWVTRRRRSTHLSLVMETTSSCDCLDVRLHLVHQRVGLKTRYPLHHPGSRGSSRLERRPNPRTMARGRGRDSRFLGSPDFEDGSLACGEEGMRRICELYPLLQVRGRSHNPHCAKILERGVWRRDETRLSSSVEFF